MEFSELFDPAQASAWDAFALGNPGGHVFQTWAWGELCRREGWGVRRFAVTTGSRILAAVQILRRSRNGFCFWYAPRGPVFHEERALHCLLDRLASLILSRTALFLKINPGRENTTGLAELLAGLGFRKVPRRELHVCTYRIDLTQPAEQVWANFKGNVRTSVRKAEKSGVIVRPEDDEAGLRSFYTVYRTMQGRAAVPPYDYFQRRWETLAPLNRAKVFTARLDGEPLAACFLLLHADRAEQMWTAARRLEGDLGATQLLDWRIIAWLKERGCPCYDLGGVPPESGKLPGIAAHKKALGGGFVELIGEYDRPGNRLLYSLWQRFGNSVTARRISLGKS